MNNFEQMAKMQQQYLDMMNQHAQRMHESFMLMGDLAKMELSQTQGFVPPTGFPPSPVPMSPVTQPVVQQHQQRTDLPPLPEQPPVVDSFDSPKNPEPAKVPGILNARIKAIKPCDSCPLNPINGGNCIKHKKHDILPECGPELEKLKQAAEFNGEITIQIAKKKGEEHNVYRDGVFIGIVPKIDNITDLLVEFERYIGKTVRVRTTWDRNKKEKVRSIYTNCSFEILDVMQGEQEDSSTSPVTPPPTHVGEPVSKPEDATFDLGKMELPC